MNIGVVNVIHLLKKRGQIKDLDINRRSSLKWDVKKQTPHVATEAFFSSIGFFGQVWNTDDFHSHDTEMEVLTALPQYLDIQLG